MRVVRARGWVRAVGVVLAAGSIAAVGVGAYAAETPSPITTTAPASPSTTTTTSSPATTGTPTVTVTTTATPAVTVTAMATVTAPPATVTVTAPPATVAAPPATVTVAPIAAPKAAAGLAAAAREVWVFGDSITVGGWLPDPLQAWPYLVARQAVPLGINVRNFGVGGSVLHRAPGSTGPLMLEMLQNRFAGEATIPDVVVLAIGTNDMLNHTLDVPGWSSSSVVASMYAAIDVETYLKGKGVKRVVWNTIYPFAQHDTPTYYGAAIPWYWVEPLRQRVDYFNEWLYAMWGDDIVNTNATLRDWQNPLAGDSRYFIDGFHPTTEGHARIAASFLISALTP